MAVDLELRPSEVVEKQIKGDYWEGSIFSTKKSGSYWFTNERILFRGGLITAWELSYSEIDSATLCNVGPLLKFLPTGIKLTMKDGKSYRLSLMKRKALLAFIEEKRQR